MTTRAALIPWLVMTALAFGCGDSVGGDVGPGTGAADGTTGGRDGSGATASTGGGASGGAGTGAGGGSPVTLGDERDGEATYYAATGDGACMLGASPDDLMVAALNAPDWAGSAWCGACADVTGPSGAIRIRVVDLCPECASGDLDLSPQAFALIAPLEQGRVPISWHFVACDVSGPVAYRYKDGVNQWWTAVQVLNHRLPIQSMEFSKDGAAWTPMARQDYNYFLTESGFGEGATRVRITALDGQSLVDELPAVEEYLVTPGAAQFQ